MPPRLAHRKSRAGCMRCKARKVKCDETLPKCAACVRHNVSCVYPSSATAVPTAGSAKELHASEHALELRLMHEWMAYVCESFSIAWQFWRYQAPLIAFEHRYLLDALFALSALHVSRQTPKVWDPVEGRMVSLDGHATDADGSPALTGSRSLDVEWKAVSNSKAHASPDGAAGALSPSPKTHADMLHVSQTYFDRALDGQRKAVAEVNADNIQAVYMCSILVTNYGLLILGEDSSARPDAASLHPIKWFRIAEGSRQIALRWREVAGENWFRLAGNFYGQPDLSDDAELFHPRHRTPFAYLLAPVGGDAISDSNDEGGGDGATEREAYEHTLSYVGLLYTGIVQKRDLPRASCRRVIALPSRVPPRFAQMVEEQRPRALAVLAHVFAAIKLLDADLPWFKGIAERQVPMLARELPEAWLPMLRWPLDVARGVESNMLSKS